jgi:hypothetical protein
MNNFFVEINTNNDIKGYLNSDIHTLIPDSAIEITEAQWQGALEINANKFISGAFSYVEPEPEPLTAEEQITELKAVGIEIQGHMISLNESNQNGLSSISTMIDKAIKLALDSPFPIYPTLETKNGKARLTANNQSEFDLIYVSFGVARNGFFQ